MANTIQLRNSVVKDKTPLPSELVIGEVCVGAHSDSPMLLFKDNADNIIKIEPGGGVTKLVAGANVTLDPTEGIGEVTISADTGTDGLWEISDVGGENYLAPISPNENIFIPGELRLQGDSPTAYFKQMDGNTDEGRADITFEGDGTRTDWRFVYRTRQGGLDVDKGSVIIYPAGCLDVSIATTKPAFRGGPSTSANWNTATGSTVFAATNYSVGTFTADTMGNVYVRRELNVGSETPDGGAAISGTMNVFGTLKATTFDLESLDPLPA